MSGSTLAIAVCTFNRGPAIARTLAALDALDRAGGRLTRVVVVDNNCTDGTPDAVRAFAAGSRLPVEIVREPAQGLTPARRRAVLATTEDAVAFIDDDCLPDPGWAAAVLGVMDRRPAAGAVGGRIELEFEAPPPRAALARAALLARQDRGDAERRLDSPREPLVGAALAVRRAALLRTGWMERSVLTDRAGATLASGGDLEMGILLRRAGAERWYTPGARCRHLIPAARTGAAYLLRLAEGVSRAEAALAWLEAGEPGAAWARAGLERAERKRRRTALLEWRPWRRPFRLAERRGRAEGWRDLVSRLESGDLRPAGGGH